MFYSPWWSMGMDLLNHFILPCRCVMSLNIDIVLYFLLEIMDCTPLQVLLTIYLFPLMFPDRYYSMGNTIFPSLYSFICICIKHVFRMSFLFGFWFDSMHVLYPFFSDLSSSLNLVHHPYFSLRRDSSWKHIEIENLSVLLYRLGV